MKMADLSHLSSEQAEAARRFVDLKFQVDTMARDYSGYVPDDLHGPMGGGEYGPSHGMCFFNRIIPFLPRDFEVHEPEILYVPIAHTLGCSWRWWPDRYLSEENEEGIKLHIFSDYGIRSTSYTYIPELGLFLPGEGKNRVNFCRHHNINAIPARVYIHHYPKADRIKFYVKEEATGRDILAVLDNRYVQKVDYYAFALPVLQAYGVIVSCKWPSDLPSTDDIRAYASTSVNNELFYRPVVDLDKVRVAFTKKEEEAFIRTTLFHLLPVRKKFTYIFVFMLIFVVAMTLWDHLGEGSVANMLFAAGAFAVGSLFVMMVPVFRVRKKYLTDESQ